MLTTDMIYDLIIGIRQIFADSVVQIILYGSVARQENTKESDIDIAVIVDNAQMDDIRDRFIEWSSEMDMKYNRVFSILDIEKNMMDKWGNILPFYKNIRKDGVVLWKAA